ncbi:methyltransferase family protein [Arcticibacter pallidicorallinus]|uniref:Methyltransferase family protein n=1 Tax=Arcticibacter pallidicorallinus TaxID=1259464 RepID=A0A2T0U570_9SPHI|nr:methyltransferase domain-containing protein [Arcticibacter pallidicorallinus]PRY53075.1 methyltransferase family protein [Arcticibacter pallidicorallinus]
MPDFSRRSKEVEIMDNFALDHRELDPVLKELEVINKLLGGFSVFYDAFRQLKLQNGDTVSDWGCGGGDSLRVLQGYFRRQSLDLRLIGIDATAAAVEFATKRNSAFKNMEFRHADVLEHEFDDAEFDVVISSLFTHHFDDEQWIVLIRKMVHSAKKAVIINDLHRHWFAYHAIGVLTGLFSKSPMVKHDSKISVLRSFRRAELENLIRRAGFSLFTIKWMWAFRWQVIIYK